MSGTEGSEQNDSELSSTMRNKVNPECSNVSEEGTSRTSAIRERWNDFVESTTLHGLAYVVTSKSRIRRILWAVFLLVAIVFVSYQSFTMLKKYFSFPNTTKVSLKYDAKPDFPAVTICNFNKFRNSVIEDLGLDAVANKSVDLNKVINITQLFYAAGHQINDTLAYCVWNSKQTCDYRNFTPVMSSMGLCHTFNSGKNGQSVLKVNEAGADFGLYMMLNVQQYEYFGVESRDAGLRVRVHHQNTLPMVSQLGFAVSPGTSVFAGIQKQRVINLPKPYESNCYDGMMDGTPDFTTYTISSCMLLCETRFVIKECGCRSVEMSELNGTKHCSNNRTLRCLFKAKAKFQTLKEDQCDCRVPCDAISYKPSLSYAAFPSEGYLSRGVKEAGNNDNLTLEQIKEGQEQLRRNFLELRVYYQDLNYQVIEETPAYELQSLLGEIGGQVGLCVGASLLTLLEFCDVILGVVGIRMGWR
ncbi:acid-sensing ion channel 4-like [Stylophora pistillata]|uniref:acid-sensing ion channel 4-like n=1 Tax=Stylophora pistillata TaxID=50429 RepID=UPI000C04EF8B|nr:acid-sensing ion channel 4-like [Stylophora pistillata]